MRGKIRVGERARRLVSDVQYRYFKGNLAEVYNYAVNVAREPDPWGRLQSVLKKNDGTECTDVVECTEDAILMTFRPSTMRKTSDGKPWRTANGDPWYRVAVSVTFDSHAPENCVVTVDQFDYMSKKARQAGKS